MVEFILILAAVGGVAVAGLLVYQAWFLHRLHRRYRRLA